MEKAESLETGSGVVGITEHHVEAANHVEVDPVLERRVIRKFDLLVMPQMVLLVILAYLDRSNIGKCFLFSCFRSHAMCPRLTRFAFRKCPSLRLRGGSRSEGHRVQQHYHDILRHLRRL